MVYDVDLINCDVELIYFLGCVQKFGYFLVVDKEWIIFWVFENIVEIIGVVVLDFLGQLVDVLLECEVIYVI